MTWPLIGKMQCRTAVEGRLDCQFDGMRAAPK
jgi:hypothetical protein